MIWRNSIQVHFLNMNCWDEIYLEKITEVPLRRALFHSQETKRQMIRRK